MSMKTLSSRLLNYVSSNRGKYDEETVIAARLVNGSNNKTAEALGVPRRTVDRIVSRVVNRAKSQGEVVTAEIPRVLVLDIERAPMLSYLWSFWDKYVPINFQERPTYVLSWAAKWLDEDEVMVDALCYDEDYEVGVEDDSRMLQGIWDLLDEADFIVAHNGDKFDIKVLNTAFLLAGMHPPSPYKQIDTLKIAKRCFKFDSNKLDYILRVLEGRPKHDVGGFEIWRGCMSGDMEAWDKLIEYNKDDVRDLEAIYLKMRSWDKSHPSMATHGATTGQHVCTVCGSEDVRPAKPVSTGASVFPGFVCGSCGHHMRGRTSLLTAADKQQILMNAR